MANKSSKKTENKKEHENKSFYKQNYKKFLVIPAILFIISIILITITYNSQKSPIYRDISLKGGLSIVLEKENIDIINLENQLSLQFPQNSFSISELSENGQITGAIIDTDLDEQTIVASLEQILETQLTNGDNYTSNYISPTLSNAFFIQALYILLISFILMSLVVFLYFKEFVPSGAVVLSAIFDIIVTIAILDALQIKISIAGIGAIIMLIGYSIDTDVLLTNRLIKEPGKNYFEKSFEAFKTGTLMSATTLIAGLGALLLTNSEIIAEIATILVVGLLVDFVSTWIQNTAILLWWLEKKQR